MAWFRARREQRRVELEQRAAAWVDARHNGHLGRRDLAGLAYFDASFRLVADRTALFTALIDAAITLTRADMGNLQLLDRSAGGLRIVTQRGFESEFLGYFGLVADVRSACGLALARGKTVTVEDVKGSPVFDDEAADVVLGAGVRAVHSIPLPGMRPRGELRGVLSVHYSRPGGPDERDAKMLGLLAIGAARLTRLERG